MYESYQRCHDSALSACGPLVICPAMCLSSSARHTDQPAALRAAAFSASTTSISVRVHSSSPVGDRWKWSSSPPHVYARRWGGSNTRIVPVVCSVLGSPVNSIVAPTSCFIATDDGNQWDNSSGSVMAAHKRDTGCG